MPKVTVLSVNIDFDFRSDTPAGRDPDSASRTLRQYHRLLWSKPLPSGAAFELDDSRPGVYLHHSSALGEFWLGSDSIVHTYSYWERTAAIVAEIPERKRRAFQAVANTIGGYIVFPSNKIIGAQSINQRRGTNRSIDDRFDLTLECIRRHYLGRASPIADTLEVYADYFALFETFAGYVDFFLLHDLVTRDYASVRWFIPFNDFEKPAHPRTVEQYDEYRRNCMAFVGARNRRIRNYCAPRARTLSD